MSKYNQNTIKRFKQNIFQDSFFTQIVLTRFRELKQHICIKNIYSFIQSKFKYNVYFER